MAGKTKSIALKRMQRLLFQERREIYAIYFYAALNGVIMLSLPLGIQAVLNFTLGGSISTSWVLLIAAITASLIIAGLLQISQLKITEKLQQRIFVQSSLSFAYRIPKLKLENVHKNYAPELMNRFFDTLTIQKGLAKLLIDFSTALLQMLFGLILLALYHPLFIFVGLFILTFIYIVFRYTSPKGMETSLMMSKQKYLMAFWIEEMARALPTFKLAGKTNLPFLRADVILKKYVEYRNKRFSVLVSQYVAMIILKVSIVGALLIAGSLLLLGNEISIGQFVAAEIIIIIVVASVEKLILSLETVYDTLTGTEKLGQIFDLPLERENKEEVQYSPDENNLKVEAFNLSFGFPDNTDPLKPYVINNVSFTVEPREKVVITGVSGSGKSVLLKLLAGTYTEFKGKLKYNGIPSSVLNTEKLRSLIGDGFFEEKLFEGTLKENITVGREGITDSQILISLEEAGLKNWVGNLDLGIDTPIFAEGAGLSNAVIEKILLARAIVIDPPILLIEKEFNYDRIEKNRLLDLLFSKRWSLIVSTTDPEIIARAEKVIELENGEISFEGSPKQYEIYKSEKL
jgi:ABC-type bacteriocin/lantibiotic exporter with double-glycine peptidase domain